MQSIVNYYKATIHDTCCVFSDVYSGNTKTLIAWNVYQLILNLNIEMHCKQSHTNLRCFVKCKPLFLHASY
jgi:hypothetical protein